MTLVTNGVGAITSLEIATALDIANVMRRRAADLGHRHPWSSPLASMASEWEQTARDIEASPAPEGPEPPSRPSLQLVD